MKSKKITEENLKRLIRKVLLEDQKDEIEGQLDEMKDGYTGTSVQFYLKENPKSQEEMDYFKLNIKYIKDIEYQGPNEFKLSLSSNETSSTTDSYVIYNCNSNKFNYDYEPKNPKKTQDIILYSDKLSKSLKSTICTIKPKQITSDF